MQRAVLFTEDDPLVLTCGRVLAPVEVAYTVTGTLNAARDNAVFICHALTGDAEVETWWGSLVGPGRPVDTDRFYVICPNLLGGCRGTTGPSSPDLSTGRAYGLRFPPLSVSDLVAVHRRLLAHLGIERLHGALGGSLGGMQVLDWLLDAPEQVGRAGIIAASGRLTAENIAFSAVARGVIMGDPGFSGGDYEAAGTRADLGLATARRLAHITYLSELTLEQRFGRERRVEGVPADAADWLGTRFEVESYLDHQAASFLARFDPLTYLWLTRVMDDFDPFARAPALADTAARALVLSFSSDWRFPTAHSRALARDLRAAGLGDVTETEVDSPHGHDSFLLDLAEYHGHVTALLR